MRKRAEAFLRRVLRRLPKLAGFVGDLSELLRFLPVEITRQKAVFEVRERGRPRPKGITLCYDGWGGRLALPIPGTLEDAVDELLRRTPGVGRNETIRGALRKLIKEELETLLPKRVTHLLAKLDSNVPGPWKPFELTRSERLTVFKGPSDMFVDVISNLSAPGHVWLAFDGPRWGPHRDRVAMKVDGQVTSVIPLQVDGGVGFDLLSVNKGSLVDQGCACAGEHGAEAEAELFEWI